MSAQGKSGRPGALRRAKFHPVLAPRHKDCLHTLLPARNLPEGVPDILSDKLTRLENGSWQYTFTDQDNKLSFFEATAVIRFDIGWFRYQTESKKFYLETPDHWLD